MSRLSDIADDYLRLRRSLGHDLADAHRLLPRFVAYLDGIGAATVTIDAALAWVTEPDVDPSSSVWPRRMIVARRGSSDAGHGRDLGRRPRFEALTTGLRSVGSGGGDCMCCHRCLMLRLAVNRKRR